MHSPPKKPASSLQWYVGFLVLGWGLSILVGIVPHEDLVVGAGLAVLGAALALASRRVPDVPSLPSWVTIPLGATMVLGGTAFGALRGWNAAKLAIISLGALLAGLTPLGSRVVRMPFGGRTRVSTLTASLLPMALGPAAVYAIQGLTGNGSAASPIEHLLQASLLAPMTMILRAFGWDPVRTGQTIAMTTPHGPLRLSVGVACSGLQAMSLFGGILGLLLLLERPPPRRAAWLCLVGLAGVYAVNLLRLVLLAVVGYNLGPDALEQAHAQAGWMLFVAWALAFCWIATRKPAGGRTAAAAPRAPPAQGTPPPLADGPKLREGAARYAIPPAQPDRIVTRPSARAAGKTAPGPVRSS